MNKGTFLTFFVTLALGLGVGYWSTQYANQRYAEPAPVTSAKFKTPPEKLSDIKKAEDLAGGNPQSFDAQMQAAQINNDVKNYPETLEHLSLANKLRPDNYEAIVALGNINFDMGYFIKAESWYQSALSKKPKEAGVRTDLGSTFLFRDPPDLPQAIAEFRRALEINPKSEIALQNLATALVRKGDGSQARAVLLRLETVQPANPFIAKLRAQLEGTADTEPLTGNP